MLTDTQRRFLDQPRSAVLATHRRDGTAVQSVVWYVRDDDSVWVSVAPTSLKARHLRRDPRLSLLVLSEDGMAYLSLEGTADITEDVTTPERLRLIGRYLGAEGAAAYIARHPLPGPNARIRITITRATGHNLGE